MLELEIRAGVAGEVEGVVAVAVCGVGGADVVFDVAFAAGAVGEGAEVAGVGVVEFAAGAFAEVVAAGGGVVEVGAGAVEVIVVQLFLEWMYSTEGV